MEVNVKIGVSNRHIHLNEETYNMLFDEPLNEIKLNVVSEIKFANQIYEVI